MRDMRESGVTWIGEIPTDWSLIRFKDKYTNIKEVAKERSVEFERLALTLNGVIKRPKDDSEGLQPKEFDGYQILRENDFVFKMIDLQNISTSRVGLSPYTGLVSPAYIRFSPKEPNQYNQFVYYYLMSMYYNRVYNNLGGNGVRSALNGRDMGEFVIPYPSESEQREISAFLDKKCNQVNALIENVQAQIEKLKAYKQSVITEVVIKGLDPTVPMKDSGVDRLDRIPMHWRIVKQTMLTTRIGDGLHGTPEFDDSSNIFFINGNNLGEKYITVRENTKSVLPSEYEKYRLDLNDRTLLISLNGTIGSISRYNGEIVVFGKSAGYIIVKNNINIDYLSYYLQTRCVKEIFELSFAGTTIKNLSLETLRNLRVCVPPHEEQEAIVVYLDEKCSQIDRLIAIKQAKIEKLEQYKKSLIYEYVTGKKEMS